GGDRQAAIAFGEALLMLILPAPLGAIPWAAGELLSGESKRHLPALCASIATAYALSIANFELVGLQHFWGPVPPAFLTRLGGAILGGDGAAGAYLIVRGEPIEPAPVEAIALERLLADWPGAEVRALPWDYSSSISEKRSFRGCSSGFF